METSNASIFFIS